MSRSSNWLREFFGGTLALSGASLVSWQAVLIYYLVTGRVEVGEEHPPFSLIAVFFVTGVLLIVAGYRISKSAKTNSRADKSNH